MKRRNKYVDSELGEVCSRDVWLLMSSVSVGRKLLGDLMSLTAIKVLSFSLTVLSR